MEIREETGDALNANHFSTLRWKFEDYLAKGFRLTSDRIYRHLHHSQSQLKEKQYWFYWHDQIHRTNLSFEQAYDWMGDFRHERVVAKHAARIAQCFTSSEATIRVRHFPNILFFHRWNSSHFRFHEKKRRSSVISNEMDIFLPMVSEHSPRVYEMKFVIKCIFDGNLASCKFVTEVVKEQFLSILI